MYCIRCGADNLDAAKFCRKCGEHFGEGHPVDDEQETQVAVRAGSDHVQPSLDDETEIFAITPTLMFVKGGYVLAAFGALLLVAIFNAAFPSVSILASILLAMLLFLIPAYYHFRQKLLRYKLTDSKLEIDSGFISRTTRNVPIRRIQDVTVSSTPWQRLLGFGDVVIDNASEEGGKVVLKNINTPKKYADILLKQMRHLER